MRYAVNLPNFGPYADPRTVAALAADAEAAGWDGLFIWDHVTFIKVWTLEIGDPWIILTAAALATERRPSPSTACPADAWSSASVSAPRPRTSTAPSARRPTHARVRPCSMRA